MLDSEEKVATEHVEESEDGDAQGGDNPTLEDSQHEELVVSIGEEPVVDATEEQSAPGWVRKLRKRNRELDREVREARKKLQEIGSTREPELGDKPTLQGYDYDTEKYEQALTSWYDRKRKADERAIAAEAESKKAEQEWQARLGSYQQAKSGFKAPDFDEAEAVVLDLLDQTQQGVIVHGATDAALVVYALGKNEEKAKELAAIKDPVKFAFAVARLEGQLKVSTRKPTTQPEGRVSGDGRPSGAIDKTLERLREDAAKTGDYTKVAEYKRSKGR